MATTPRRGKPDFWVSTLAKFVAGERQCEWALWFASRYKFDRVKDPTFDDAKYTAEHDALRDAKIQALTEAGYEVEKEKFVKAPGTFATIAGKTDIKAMKNGVVLVVDAKTGQKRHSDWFQVLTYMLIIPIAWERPTLRVAGEVIYKDGTRIPIEPEELTAEMRTKITGTVKRIALMNEPPPHAPSEQECRYCPIGKNDCEKRIEVGAEAAPMTDLF